MMLCAFALDNRPVCNWKYLAEEFRCISDTWCCNIRNFLRAVMSQNLEYAPKLFAAPAALQTMQPRTT